MEAFSYFTFTRSSYYPFTFPKDMTSLEGTSGFSGLTCNPSSQIGYQKAYIPLTINYPSSTINFLFLFLILVLGILK